MSQRNTHTLDRLAIIDFETCDTATTTQVLTLGATFFNPTERNSFIELEAQSFYANFKPQDDRTFSLNTIKFWMQQDSDVQQKAFSSINAQSPNAVLANFNYWLKNNNVTHLVGNGASFDNAILNSLYKQYKIDPVIPFWNDLDLRTMKWLSAVPKPLRQTELVLHDARYDAIYEAECFQHYYHEIPLALF